MSIYCFDIDDTICTTNGMDYSQATPLIERIAVLNSLFDDGNIIKLNTARGSKTGIDWTDLTKHQLKSWGVKYHELHMAKPYADYYIDDKGVYSEDFFRGTDL